MRNVLLLSVLLILGACSGIKKDAGVPEICFLDAFEDATLAQARTGFIKALRDSGFSEDAHTLILIYRNAQGDIPTLSQACDFFVSEKPDLIATNSTLATITAVQKTKTIPVCMMVAPRPDLAGLSKPDRSWPSNLFGVYETLDYIDTSVALIREIIPGVKIIGTLYNQAEPNSINSLQHLKDQCKKMNLELVSIPVTNSSETQMAVQGLITKGIDVFFALPDNTVFASFETIQKVCQAGHVPVFTSEAGLVQRGALAALGADMFHWGYQAGVQAVGFLRSPSHTVPQAVIVKERRRVCNRKVANALGLSFNLTSFTVIP